MTPESVTTKQAAPELDPTRLPRHVGIIMDGNGRWARSRGWSACADTSAVQRWCVWLPPPAVGWELNASRCTPFSSENWSRPRLEVRLLMRLLQDFLVRERDTLMDNGIRLTAVGQIDRLPAAARERLDETIALTENNQGMTLSLALSYGGRDEMVDAVQRIAQSVAAGRLTPEQIDAACLDQHMYAPDTDVDVVIRTAGEQRLSNFLLWQAAYAEYVSVPELWPDFTETSYVHALACFQQRERRFGKVADASSS